MTNAAVATDDQVAEAQTIAKEFDPHDYVRRIKGKGGDKDYLDVVFRIRWFRHENPDGLIETEAIELSERIAIFRARVSKGRRVDPKTGEISEGGVATGHGTETPGDFTDFIEKAETKALGRALNALGYGIQFVLDADEAIDSSPVDRKPTPIRKPSEPTFGDKVKDAVKVNKKETWAALFDQAGSDRGKWAQIITLSASVPHLERIAEILTERDLMNEALTYALKSREKALTKA